MDLLYVISTNKQNKEELLKVLQQHQEIRFVSLVGIDFLGNDTDEKIPVKNFIEDIETFLHGTAVQTDGSSVILPGIATLNNAKVDMKVDLTCNWFIDYNYDYIDEKTGKPVGTIRMPCHLYHEGIAVDSRYILKNSVNHFRNSMMKLFKENEGYLSNFNISYDDIEDVSITSATELEFWVNTPNELAEIEELSTSEVLKEQYWKRTKGPVRTALEKSLDLLEKYGLVPEMGHKEVGGVKAKLSKSGDLTHIMEQLEVDWKFSTALQTCDNELLVRGLIKETFRRNGLEVTFQAKPVDEAAGNGEHLHVGIILKLKSGKVINLFNNYEEKDFVSEIGYGALMGMLKNYEVVNPFVSSSTDALQRLKPGFEAPVCIVTSLGTDKEKPSRNRTVLIGLIRDEINPMATRFELRSPNPNTNIYLVLAATIISMIDGISYVVKNNKHKDELLKELSKNFGEKADYLEENRCYRSEEDVFEFYTEEERESYFGKAPRTVYENILAFDNNEKVKVLTEGNVMSDKFIKGYSEAVLERWITELEHRIIPNYSNEIRSIKRVNCDDLMEYDLEKWSEVNRLREKIMKDNYVSKSLFTQMREAISDKNYSELSELEIALDVNMKELRKLNMNYRRNLMDM
ncbi:MAG: glutamine synthetase [Clostridium sp.]|uniref:glutamine synthetase n=1 Tax=Clostridium sp. TaxID=1506 RepID=UPI00305B7521